MKHKSLFVVLTLISLVSMTVPVPQKDAAVAFADALHVSAEGSDNSDILDSLFGGGGKDSKSGDAATTSKEESGGESDSPIKKVVEANYSEVLKKWRTEGVKDTQNVEIVIPPAAFAQGAGQPGSLTEAEGYEGQVFRWDEDVQQVAVDVQVPQDGLYEIVFDYASMSDKISPIERGIQINGEYPYYEARRVVFPKLWADQTAAFEQDELGNEITPRQQQLKRWQSASLWDASYLTDEPLKFHLKQGNNRITLAQIREPLLLGKAYIRSAEPLPDYKRYRTNQAMQEADETLLVVEAEHPNAKSEPSIQATASAEPNVQPERHGVVTLNTLGGKSWTLGGQSATWKVKVDKTGGYRIAFKYIQSTKTSMPVFQTLKIDGKVPFQQVNRYPFPYTAGWRNEVLSDAGGEPFLFNLEQGEHEITLVSNPAPYGPVVEAVRDVMWEINALSLQIKMATGDTKDTNRDWNIMEQIPDIAERMNSFAKRLREQYAYLETIAGERPDEARNMVMTAEKLEALAAEPEKIPYRFNRLSEGSGSVMQMLGEMNTKLPAQQFQLDRFYVYSGSDLPAAQAGFFSKLLTGIQSFFLSFTKDYSKIASDDEDALQIWVNRPRQYVMLLQQLANQDFTRETGIKVSLSLMPDEQKLILANAANNSPDAALGVSNWIPFNLALRGALAPMSKFDGYDKTAGRFSPGALVPYQFDGNVYALPETQNFWVLFYRKDILDALNIPVPDTMDDVKAILPELQRFGMNFYIPLSATGGFKPFTYTAPFIYQSGGYLYNKDGMTTAIDKEEALAGFKQMSDLFTVYSIPLQVPSFYNQFRDGSLPIGIADYGTYVQLTSAAPELAGWWKIAPYPGVKNKSGEVVRWAPGTGASTIIFNNSKKQEQAWKFIEWWTSTDVQVRYGNELETVYGPTYKWNSSNAEAFSQLPWPKEDITVIQNQWKWLWDVPRYLGDYMLEREMSDAWSKIVFDGFNARRAIEDAVINSNREINKKLEEFGYVRDGKPVKQLLVPEQPNTTERGEQH